MVYDEGTLVHGHILSIGWLRTVVVVVKKDDGSVWADLTDEGLDEKLLLRSDGTSVYMTQDLGTADLKYHMFPFDESIYVVGNEQDYHFDVLFKLLKKLGRNYLTQEWLDGYLSNQYFTGSISNKCWQTLVYNSP